MSETKAQYVTDPLSESILAVLRRGPVSHEQLLNELGRDIRATTVCDALDRLAGAGVIDGDWFGREGERPRLRWHIPTRAIENTPPATAAPMLTGDIDASSHIPLGVDTFETPTGVRISFPNGLTRRTLGDLLSGIARLMQAAAV